MLLTIKNNKSTTEAMTTFLKIPVIFILITLSALTLNSCKKKPTPPEVTTSGVFDITQTTATAGGNVTSDGGAEVTARGVCWSTSDNPSIANSSKTSDGGGVGSFTSNVTGLTAQTPYFLRAYATNSEGTSYGNPQSFTTPGNPPVAAFTASPTTIAIGQSVKFTDASTNNPTSWSWDFGDGGTSTSQNPEYIYNTAGTFTVKLTVTNSFGSDDEIKTNLITVLSPPKYLSSVVEDDNTSLVVITFDFLNSSVVPAASAFNVNVNSAIITITMVQISDNKVYLTLANAIKYGDIVAVSYIKPATNPLQTNEGAQAESFSDKQVTNNVKESVPPINFNSALTYGTVSDIDGNSYKTIKIGTQVWMAENLKVTKYNDGTPVHLVNNSVDWSTLTTEAYCWYDDNPSKYRNVYGALYNWDAVTTGKLCMTGWHVPTATEFMTLGSYLGGNYPFDATKLREAGTDHWEQYPGTNETGFTVLPGGYRSNTGVFSNIRWTCYFFTTSSDPYNSSLKIQITISIYSMTQITCNKNDGYSVRCLKD